MSVPRRVSPGWTLLVPLGAGYFVSYMFRNMNGTLAPDISSSLGLGADALGLSTSLYFLVFAAAQIPVGVLLDRYGPRRVQTALLLCAASGAAISALSGGLVGICLGRALIGLGTAGSLVAALKMSASTVRPERQSLTNSLIVMCGGLGAVGSTWPIEMLLPMAGWRGVTAVLGGLACLVALTVWVAVPGTAPAGSRGAVSKPPGIGMLLRDPVLQGVAPLSAACFGSVLAIHGLWAGPWLADVEAMSRPEVMTGLALMGGVLVVAAPCWGFLTEALRRRMPLPLGVLGAAVLLMAVETALLLPHSRLPVMVPVMLPWGLFALFGGMSVLTFAVVAAAVPAASVGRANGLVNVAHIGCSFLVQFGMGQVIALWAPQAGHYPAPAYHAALLLPFALQAAALVWFVWRFRAALLPRRSKGGLNAIAAARLPLDAVNETFQTRRSC